MTLMNLVVAVFVVALFLLPNVVAADVPDTTVAHLGVVSKKQQQRRRGLQSPPSSAKTKAGGQLNMLGKIPGGSGGTAPKQGYQMMSLPPAVLFPTVESPPSVAPPTSTTLAPEIAPFPPSISPINIPSSKPSGFPIPIPTTKPTPLWTPQPSSNISNCSLEVTVQSFKEFTCEVCNCVYVLVYGVRNNGNDTVLLRSVVTSSMNLLKDGLPVSLPPGGVVITMDDRFNLNVLGLQKYSYVIRAFGEILPNGPLCLAELLDFPPIPLACRPTEHPSRSPTDQPLPPSVTQQYPSQIPSTVPNGTLQPSDNCTLEISSTSSQWCDLYPQCACFFFVDYHVKNIGNDTALLWVVTGYLAGNLLGWELPIHLAPQEIKSVSDRFIIGSRVLTYSVSASGQVPPNGTRCFASLTVHLEVPPIRRPTWPPATPSPWPTQNVFCPYD